MPEMRATKRALLCAVDSSGNPAVTINRPIAEHPAQIPKCSYKPAKNAPSTDTTFLAAQQWRLPWKQMQFCAEC